MKIKYLLLSLSILCFQNGIANIERRAAFDIGSGSIKLLIADIDIETQHVRKYIFSQDIKVPFISALAKSSNGSFTQAVQSQAKEAFALLMQRAKPYHPKNFFGVATEAFRLAKNGEQLATMIANEFKVPIQIISQEEEAELGFYSALEHSQRGDLENTIVWDIGGGSFQISWYDGNGVCSYMGNFGKVPMKHLIISSIQGKSLHETHTPNPISYEEAILAKSLLIQQLSAPSEDLQKKLQNPLTRVLGIGAIHHNIAWATGIPTYTLSIVDDLLKNRLGFGDDHFGREVNASFWVSDLIFISSIMSHLKIQSVFDLKSFGHPKIEVSGNTIGIIIRPEYWKCNLDD